MNTLLNIKIIAAAALALSTVGGAILYEQHRGNDMLSEIAATSRASFEADSAERLNLEKQRATYVQQRKADLDELSKMAVPAKR